MVSARSRSAGLAASRRDQRRQVVAQQRLAAGQADAVDAELGEAVDQRRDLLEVEDVAARQPDVVLLRHAVLAAQIAAVGHRDAQVAQRPAEAVVRRWTCGASMPGCRDGRKNVQTRYRRHSADPVRPPTAVQSGNAMPTVLTSRSMITSSNHHQRGAARQSHWAIRTSAACRSTCRPTTTTATARYPVVYFLAGFSGGGVVSARRVAVGRDAAAARRSPGAQRRRSAR